MPSRGDDHGPQAVNEPRLPSEQEQELHRLLHLPFATWCDLCVASKGAEEPHRGKKHGTAGLVDEVPVVQMDFFFIESLVGLSIYATELGIGSTSGVASKSVSTFAVNWATHIFSFLGLSRIILQTDAEASVRALAEKIAQKRSETTQLRVAPVRSHESQGGVERWHRQVEEQFRVVKSQLEKQIQATITPTMAICVWLLRHASWLLMRFQPSTTRSGTGYYRVRGRSYSGRLVGFGETVLALESCEKDAGGVRKQSKFKGRWVLGVWVGRT